MQHVHAATLGGSCCADLEEEIEDLQDLGKGNRKVSLQGSGAGAKLSFSPGSWNLALSTLGSVVVDSSGNPFAISGVQIAVLDRTAFANADRGGIALMRGVDNALTGVLDDDAYSGLWAVSLGSFADVSGGPALLDAEQSLGGGLAGVTFKAAPAWSLGAFGGAAQAELETDFEAESIETDYGLVGAYARFAASRLVVDFSVTGAWSSSDGARLVAVNAGSSPFETARSDYDGWILSPAISVGWLVPAGEGAMIVPAIKVRGQFMEFDGYTESGSSANATIAARDLDHVEGRFEVGFHKDVGGTDFAAMSVRAKAGVSVLERFGDEDVEAQLLGTALTFSSGAADSEIGGYVGLGFDAALTPAVTLFGDSEMLLSGEAQSIAGSIGLKANF
ncbi:MAG TPA: autotransporter outer membrane beta-barrel domain-containing protein [Hyphomicrobium sp.]|nr:autotransporter outer membrane beta-barrel domain-containing protein [Hyphomicrobium sp.]